MFAASKTAAVSGAAPDSQFNYVTMLLHGDGTNGAQNNTFVDSSTNNFTITRNGNTTQGSFSPYGDNWSNYFGTGNYLTWPSGSSVAFGTGDFTVECWVYLGATPTTNFLFDFRDASNTTAPAFIWGNTNSGVLDWTQNAASGPTVTSTGATWNVNTWYHIAYVRSGTTGTIYQNGVSIGSATDSTNYTVTPSTSRIAARYGSPFLEFPNGYISNVRIVKGTAVYTGAFTPSTTPLTAITNTVLLTCQSNRFIDNSTNNFAITVTGTPSVQRFNPFGASTAYSTSVIGGSGYFDGSGDSLQATAGAVPAIGTSDFIISGWWYLNELKDYQILFDFRNGSNTEAVPYVYMDSTGTADYYVNGTSHTFSVTFKAKQWYYMVISRVSGTTKVFVNGTQAVSYSDSVTYVAGRLTLGFNNNGGGTYYYYSGYISDFKVVIGSGTTSGTPTTTPATATSGTQALLSMTNGAIFDNAMMNDLETVGNAQISTSVVKYGTGSMYFDGSGDWLLGQVSQNLSFGTGDFTIEGWGYVTSIDGTYRCIISIGAPVQIYARSGTIEVYFNDTDDQSTYIVSNMTGPASSVSANTWFHFAVVRNGTTFTAYVNGVAGTPTTGVSAQVALSAYPFALGIYTPSSSYPFTGYIDDLRITKGYARYTANFTPPTAAFSNTGP